MGTQAKRFGGKLYQYYSYATTKADAQKLKNKAKKNFKLVRVVKGLANRRYTSYYIYVR